MKIKFLQYQLNNKRHRIPLWMLNKLQYAKKSIMKLPSAKIIEYTFK